ncbi:MAG: hypothetical protein ABSB79_09560 [Syntrophales bacterium]|jgi:hypothetical protein
MKEKTWEWLVIVLLFTILFPSYSKGGDDGSKENEATKQNKPVMRYDPGGLLEIQKKSDKRIKEINDGHMKELQEMQNESRERNNEN